LPVVTVVQAVAAQVAQLRLVVLQHLDKDMLVARAEALRLMAAVVAAVRGPLAQRLQVAAPVMVARGRLHQLRVQQ
jgi:hypothetical protein